MVTDSSSLFALQRGQLISHLKQIPFTVIIPPKVKEEIERGENFRELLKLVTVQFLHGRTLKKAESLEYLKIGHGEAQCCALAFHLGLDFIICNDRKFIRQRFFSNDNNLKQISVLGFAFFLHVFYKEKLIDNVWNYFHTIIKLCNWERSEVQLANYDFLKQLGH